MLDTHRDGRKLRIRRAHIMAAERCRQELQTLGGAGTVAELTALMKNPQAWALNQKIKFHETQIDLWGKSIAQFGDDDV